MNRKMDLMIVPVILGVFMILAFSMGAPKRQSDLDNMPSLPRPIAKETILITSAGQSTDTYIVKDIANKLMIHNYFMPQATTFDLDEINTIVFVIGYSRMSEKLYALDYISERERLQNLIDKGVEQNMSLITVYIGGDYRQDEDSNALLELIGSKSDYIIATADETSNQTLIQISKAHDVPLTIVQRLTDITEPFASAFR